jgi:hypothetical protein
MAEPTRWITKNGRRIPIGGGSRSGSVLVAGVIALGAVGIGGTGGSLFGSTGPGVSARKADSEKAARKGDADEAWRRMGMRALKKTVKQDLKCVGASFGRVRDFFAHTPCTSLDRNLFLVGDATGNAAVISVAWVGFRTRGQVARFKDLIDVPGTGDITPLASSLLGLADIRFTAEHYQSESNGAVLAIAETEPATGRVDPETLEALADVAALLPKP